MEREDMKRSAGEKALEYVEDGMTIGLGTGSTVAYTIKKLGELVKGGLFITGIPTSLQTKKLATDCGITLGELDDHTLIDLTIDGADEVDSNLNLVKGGGGALTREKIVAYHSAREVIVIDESKIVRGLGIDFPVAVEVVKYGYLATKKTLETLGCNAELRTIVGEVYITDNSNYILDCEFGKIDDAETLEKNINCIPGVVENGLFIGLVDEVIVGSTQGIIIRE